MKNRIITFIIIFITIACKGKVNENFVSSNNSIDKILSLKIYELTGDINPQEIREKRCIEIQKDKVYYLKEHYDDKYNYQKEHGNIIQTDTLQVIYYPNNLLESLPEKYLDKNHTFGYPNEHDEGGIYVLIEYNDRDIIWNISFLKEQLPVEIQPFLSVYFEILRQLGRGRLSE